MCAHTHIEAVRTVCYSDMSLPVPKELQLWAIWGKKCNYFFSYNMTGVIRLTNSCHLCP